MLYAMNLNGIGNHKNSQPVALRIVALACCLPLATLAASCNDESRSSVPPTDQVVNNTITDSSRAEPISTRVASPIQALELAASFANDINTYQRAAVSSGPPDKGSLSDAVRLFDPAVEVDDVALGECLKKQLQVKSATEGGLFETSVRGFAPFEASSEVTLVAYQSIQVVPEQYDETTSLVVYVGPGGIIGFRPDGAAISTCSNSSISRTGRTSAWYETARAADLSHVQPLPQGQDQSATDSTGPDLNAAHPDDGANDTWVQRPGFPADPSDPEPIASTGSNKWDLIRSDDPSTFDRLEYLGQGEAEILDPTKSFYEPLNDAYLFVASFSDGSTIDIRIHSEVGSQTVAEAEAQRYTRPLGQLPSLLRANIGRLSIRLGTETATASAGEGISVQVGNATIRSAENRLEETLFHEAVHTSLDSQFSYTRSADWLEAQAKDGRFLTEYGRENPDSEDLAETALYAWALLHHPERIPTEEREAIEIRIPNRLEFLADLLLSAGP